MELDQIKQRWIEVLDLLLESNRIAWLAFFDARLISYQNNQLTLDFLNEVNDAALSDVRVDSGVRVGDEVGVYYDPMISKIICWGPNRRVALKKMESALVGYQLAGFQTNISFLKELINLDIEDACIRYVVFRTWI